MTNDEINDLEALAKAATPGGCRAMTDAPKEPMLVIPLPVRDHLRFATIEYDPPQVVYDCDVEWLDGLIDKKATPNG